MEIGRNNKQEQRLIISYLVSKYALNVYCALGTVLGSKDTKIVSALKELTVTWQVRQITLVS